MTLRVISGKSVGRPEANFLVVDENNRVIGNDAVSLLGFPTKKLAQLWKLRLEQESQT